LRSWSDFESLLHQPHLAIQGNQLMSVAYHQGKFPPVAIDWQGLLPLIGAANRAVARYEGVLHGIPNPHVLLAPLTSQEAVLSSRIEGTQATLGEVLEFEAQGDMFDERTPKKADIREVLNYRSALREATRLLTEIPLSQRLLKDCHRVLMQGVRGRSKDPGEYRRIPNWIGPEGCTVDQARFVPCGADKIPDNMAALERFLHADEPDPLVQLAIVHAEFESIHPFLDGNGRLGRLIVPLFMVEKKLLTSPNFYVSAYFESHRDQYYERLLAVSRNGDWTGWCAFFLTALVEQAKANQNKALRILELYREQKDWIAVSTRSQYAVKALDWIFARPIFSSSDFVNHVQIPKPTANRILRVLRNDGMLKELRPASGRRPSILAFSLLLSIAEGHEAS
jgi:Fic family protein